MPRAAFTVNVEVRSDFFRNTAEDKEVNSVFGIRLFGVRRHLCRLTRRVGHAAGRLEINSEGTKKPCTKAMYNKNKKTAKKRRTSTTKQQGAAHELASISLVYLCSLQSLCCCFLLMFSFFILTVIIMFVIILGMLHNAQTGRTWQHS